MLRLNVSRNTRIRTTSSSGSTRIGGINWVGRVQPQHIGIVVIPKRHHQDNTGINCFLHGTKATLLKEIGSVLCLSHPVLAVIISDSLVLVSIHGVAGMLNGLTILRVKLLYFHKLTVVCAVIRDELGCHSDRLRRINLELRPWPEEILVAKTVRLNVTAILVTETLETIRTVVAAI